MDCNIKFTPEDRNIKTFFKSKIMINGIEWKILVNNTENYGDVTKDEISNAYAATQNNNTKIIIFWDRVLEDGETIETMLFHEIGHAWYSSMPSHCNFEHESNLSADAWECAYRFSKQINKIAKDFKKKVIK